MSAPENAPLGRRTGHVSTISNAAARAEERCAVKASRETDAALAASGWELVDLRMTAAGVCGLYQWHGTIKRLDGTASMSITHAEEAALTAELIAYARAHASTEREPPQERS